MEIKRNSFLFYYSYYDAIHDIESEEEQCQMYKIIVDYAMKQIEPTNLTPMQKMAFKLIKPNLDASIRKWQNGLKGGAPAGNQNAKKQPRNKQKSSKNQPKNNLETSNGQPKNNLETTLYIKEQEQKQDIEQEQEQEGEQEQTNKPLDDSSLDSSEISAETEFYLNLLNDKVNNLVNEEFIENEDAEKLKELFLRVASQKEIKLNKTIMKTNYVLNKFLNFFRADNDSIVTERIGKLFYTVNNTTGVKNKLKYTIGVFYNMSCGY